MNSNRIRDAVLAAIGGAAVLVHVLACTSFSPDDTKVLFTSVDAGADAPAIDVYDRETGRVERLLTLPVQSSPDGHVRAVWSDDGRRVIAISTTAIIVLPFRTRESVRVLPWPARSEAGIMNVMRAPAVLGAQFFFVDESETQRGAATVKQRQLVRMNLDNGEKKTVELAHETVVHRQRGEVYYVRRLRSPPDEKEALEFGSVDPETLAFGARLQIAISDDDDSFLFAVSADGKRVAFLSEDDNRISCRIYDGAELTKTVPVAAKGVHVGSPTFSPNGSTLYVTYCESMPGAPAERSSFGIFEVPLNGAASRKIPLFSARGAADETRILVFQLDISHDGKTAAACSSLLEDGLEPGDLALYLVDLGRADRKVTKIPIAAPSKPAGSATGN